MRIRKPLLRRRALQIGAAAMLLVTVLTLLIFRSKIFRAEEVGSRGSLIQSPPTDESSDVLSPQGRHDGAERNDAIARGSAPVHNDPRSPSEPGRPRGEPLSLERHRAVIMNSPYGTAPIEEVIRALVETPGGPEIQLVLQAIALRRNEALPIVKKRMQTGEMFEKHALTKFLRYSPWHETMPELLALARDKNEHWLARQGALYALAALGVASAGPEIAAILTEPDNPLGVQVVAIGALARIGYRDGASAIQPFAQHEDVHIRLFAARALAEFGEPVDRDFLLSALQSDHYIVRQEASEALWAVEGTDITEKLQFIARNDPHEAVRNGATQALLQRQLQGRDALGKLDVLRDALKNADRHTATWIVRTILEECGADGRAYIETLGSQDDRIGERSRALLILAAGSLE